MCLSALFLILIYVCGIYGDNSTTIIANNLCTPDECWCVSDSCKIAGKFTRTVTGNIKTMPLTINCDETFIENDFNNLTKTIGYNRLLDSNSIELNGCQVNRIDYIGFEHIPHQEMVQDLIIDEYNINRLDNINFQSFKNLKNLTFLNNQIRLFNLSGLLNINELNLINNTIGMVASDALCNLFNLKRFTYITQVQMNNDNNHNPVGRLNCLFNLTHIKISTEQFDWNQIKNLNFVAYLTIINTTLENFPSFDINISPKIEYLHMTKDNFTHFRMATRNATYNYLIHMNLSMNCITYLSLQENYFNKLELLDLSWNTLYHINDNLLLRMPQLKYLNMSHNRLAVISSNAFSTNVNLKELNIAFNHLTQIDYKQIVMNSNILVIMYRNPWNCSWIINDFLVYYKNVKITEPHAFGQFIVDKLMCIKYIEWDLMEPEDFPEYVKSTTTRSSEIEIFSKRNSRNTAIMTLCALFIGVAILAFILFLHIKCKKTEPFYRSLPRDGQRGPDNYIFSTCNRGVDVIRTPRSLPPTDYETPISSIMEPLEMRTIYEEIKEKQEMDQDIDTLNNCRLSIHKDNLNDI